MNSLIASKQTTNLPIKTLENDLDAVIFNTLNSVLVEEIKSLENLVQAIPQESLELVKMILATSGRIVFSGIGKSGLIARKLVATFSSMGKAALFLHPTEALHGDLGMVHPQDLFIILSKSGTGNEFEQILPLLTTQGNQTILICCGKGTLFHHVSLPILLPFEREACQLNLAPTSSSTLMLAFGDALAVTIATVTGFQKQDFAKYHPAGALGKNLLLTVKSLMHPKETLPLISPTSPFQEVILTITSKKLGVGIITSDNQNLLGIITDGDLRRACNQGPSVFEKQAADIMTLNPKTVSSDLLAIKALEIMENHPRPITSLIVTEENKIVGLIHMHDLISAGIGQKSH